MSRVLRELERLEHRVLGAFRCIDATTQASIDEPLAVSAEGARLLRNRTGLYVIRSWTELAAHEDAFDEPRRFDLTRSPNHHAGFGGGGPHYCMGASLARTQLRAIYTELLGRVPEIEAGEPVRLVGNFINGIKTMPCTL